VEQKALALFQQQQQQLLLQLQQELMQETVE